MTTEAAQTWSIARPNLGEETEEASTAAREWRWVALVSVILSLLAALPYVIAWLVPPPGLVFTGSFWVSSDISQYLAAIREAASQQGWLVHDHLTSEPHDPVLMYTFYVAAGKIASLLGGSPEAAYFGALVFGRLALFVAAYLFAAAFLESVKQRRIAFLLITLSSGFALWFFFAGAVMGDLDAIHPFAADWQYVELNTFLLLFTQPHLVFALACLLLTIRFWFDFAWLPKPLSAGLLLLSVMLLGLTNPFSLTTALVLVGVGTLFLGLVERPKLFAAALGTTLVIISSAPLLIYNVQTFTQDPFWGKTYSDQNIFLESPGLLSLLFGFGILPVLAGIALLRRENSTTRTTLLLLWIGLFVVLLYAPTSFQRRFGFGIHPFLAMAAVPGIWALLRWAQGLSRPQLATTLVRDGLILLLGASMVGAYVISLLTVFGSTSLSGELFERSDVARAGQWLSANTTEQDILMATEKSGNYLAGQVPGRVFTGHAVATLDSKRKNAEVQQFYDPATSESWRRELLARHGISYVLWGPYERSMGNWNPVGETYLRRVFNAGEVAVFEVYP